MHLSLQELDRGVGLGEAFRSALKRRRSGTEKSLTSTGPAMHGTALLAGVALVLRRYQHRVDLLTGCGPMSLDQSVSIDAHGTVVAQWNRGAPRPHAVVAQRSLEPLRINVELWDGYRLGAKVMLDVRPHPSSALHSFVAARLTISPGFSMQYSKHLAACCIIAQMVREGSRCNTSLEAPPVGGNRLGGGSHVEEVLGNRGDFRPRILFPEMRRLADAILPVLDPLEAPTRVKVLMRPVPANFQKMSEEVVDQGVLTALTFAAVLKVACCHVRLDSIAIIGSCVDGYCGKIKLPSNVE
jgi:hypothetical protein